MEFVNVKFLEYTASHESIKLNHSSFCPGQDIRILHWPGFIEMNCLTSGWNHLCCCILDDSMWFRSLVSHELCPIYKIWVVIYNLILMKYTNYLEALNFDILNRSVRNYCQLNKTIANLSMVPDFWKKKLVFHLFQIVSGWRRRLDSPSGN